MVVFRSTFWQRCVLFAVFCLAPAIANAAVMPTPYSTEAGFLSSGVTPNTPQTFETGNSPATGVQTVTSRSYGTTYGYTLQTSGGAPGDFLYVVSAGSNPSGNAMSTTQSGTDLLITFTSGNVTAAGANFFITHFDESRVGGSINVDFNFSGFSTQTIPVTSTTSGAADFLGFTVPSGTITSIRVHGVAGEYLTLDNVYAGVGIAPVPELPSTGIAAALFCLLVAGRAVMSGVSFKKQSQA
jgi:hypothetical protein